MSGADEHAQGAAIALGLIHAAADFIWRRRITALPLVTAVLGAALSRLPDVIEPAYHPNHRQFFHSLSFAVLLAMGIDRLKGMNPASDGERLMRYLGLVASGAYLVHLGMDASTPKSLPLIGKL